MRASPVSGVRSSEYDRRFQEAAFAWLRARGDTPVATRTELAGFVFGDERIPLVDPNEETPERMYATIAACLKDDAYKEQVRSALCSEMQKLRGFNERLLDLVS